MHTPSETVLLARYDWATDLVSQSKGAASDAANERAMALYELHLLGWSYQRIATEIGMTRARVQQLVGKGKELCR